MRKIYHLILMAFLWNAINMMPCSAYAQTPEEIAAERAILTENIRKADNAIQQAATPVWDGLRAVQRAEQWNPKPWNDLDAAANEYQRLFDHHWQTIDSSMRRLVALDPNAPLPSIYVRMPDFKPSINAWMNLCKLLDDQKMKAEDTISKLTPVLAQVKTEAGEIFTEKTWGLVGEIIPIPTSTDPYHIASKAVEGIAGALYKTLFLPILVAKAALVDIPTATYFGMDELSSSIRASRSLSEVIKYAKKLHEKLSIDLPAAQQGYEMLARFEQQFDNNQKKVDTATTEWARQAQRAQQDELLKKQAEADKAVAAIQQALASIPKSGGGESYTSLNIDVILGALYGAIDTLITTMDEKHSAKRLDDYTVVRTQTLETHAKQLEAVYKRLRERGVKISDAYQKRITAALLSPGNVDDNKALAEQLRKEREQVLERDVNVPSQNFSKASGADRNLLEIKITAMLAAAVTKANAVNLKMLSDVQEVAKRLSDEYDQRAAELQKAIALKSTGVSGPGLVTNLCGDAESMVMKPWAFDKPGVVNAKYNEMESALEMMKNEMPVLKALLSDEKKINEKYLNELAYGRGRLDAAVPAPRRTRQNAPPSNEVWRLTSFTLTGVKVGIDADYIFHASMPSFVDAQLKQLDENQTKLTACMERLYPRMMADSAAVAINNIYPEALDKLGRYSMKDAEKEKEKAMQLFAQKDGKKALYVAPDDSDGAKFLKEMREAWNSNKDIAEKLVMLQKKAALKYYLYDPHGFFPYIDAIAKIPEKIKLYEEIYNKLKEGSAGSGKDIVTVKELYSKFKDAYESKDDSKIMSFMGDEWEAGDGTTLSDLQGTLRKSFGIFDEIKYNLQNLTVNALQDGSFAVSYDITITSIIFDGNLKHVEKSTVNEVVTIDPSGKPRISGTQSGRFWYVE